jgi:hypothetical protein
MESVHFYSRTVYTGKYLLAVEEYIGHEGESLKKRRKKEVNVKKRKRERKKEGPGRKRERVKYIEMGKKRQKCD